MAVFSTLVWMNVGLIVHDKRATGRWLSRLAEPNAMLWAVLGGALAAWLLVTGIPTLRRVFHFELPGASLMAVAALSVLLALVLLEVLPRPTRRAPARPMAQ